jgi:hypothetical protein
MDKSWTTAGMLPCQLSTFPSGRSCHIYFNSLTDLTVRGESVMLNDELAEEWCTGDYDAPIPITQPRPSARCGRNKTFRHHPYNLR